jgi:hypothetical protein
MSRRPASIPTATSDSTHAGWWIRAAKQDYIPRNWSIVRTGTTAVQKTLFFNLRGLRAQLADASRLHMSVSEIDRIAVELKVPPQEIQIMEQRLAGADSSLNASVGPHGDDSWQDLILDPPPTPEEAVTSAHDAGRAPSLADPRARSTARARTADRRGSPACRPGSEPRAARLRAGRQQGTGASARAARLVSNCSGTCLRWQSARRCHSLQGSARLQRRHEGSVVEIVQFAAHRQSMRETTHRDWKAGKPIGYVMRRGLPFHGRAGG